jgi:two-component system, LuxR family, secretion system response regulator SsrB
MSKNAIRCVLLADRHHGLSEGIRSLLECEFEAVVMVADELSLIESALRLQPNLVVADLALAREDGFGWLSRLLSRCPESLVIVLSAHDEASVMKKAFEAGAVGFLRKRELATELFVAVDSVLKGRRYVPPGTANLDSPGDPNKIRKN